MVQEPGPPVDHNVHEEIDVLQKEFVELHTGIFFQLFLE